MLDYYFENESNLKKSVVGGRKNCLKSGFFSEITLKTLNIYHIKLYTKVLEKAKIICNDIQFNCKANSSKQFWSFSWNFWCK